MRCLTMSKLDNRKAHAILKEINNSAKCVSESDFVVRDEILRMHFKCELEVMLEGENGPARLCAFLKSRLREIGK